MLLDTDTRIEFSLYLLGGLLLKAFHSGTRLDAASAQDVLQVELGRPIPIDYVYLAFDWLFLMGVVEIEGPEVRNVT